MSCGFLVFMLSLVSAAGGEIPKERAVLAYGAPARSNLMAYYWVDWDQLAKQPHWNPESDPIPVRLSSLAGVGQAEVLARGVTNRFDLNALTIRRVGDSRTLANKLGVTPAELSNHWAVSTEFLVQRGFDFSIRSIQRVVMLFDGTIAEERVSTGKEMIQAMRGKGPVPKPIPMPEPERGSLPRGVRPYQPLAEAQTPGDVRAEVYGIEFTPPKIEWPPGAELPIDLASQAPRALAAIREEREIDEALILNEISIFRYHTNNPRRFFVDEWHYFIVFYFDDQTPGHRMYETVMLLDGTILRARKVPIMGLEPLN